MRNLIRRDNREAARGGAGYETWDPFRSLEPFRVMDALLRWDRLPDQGRPSGCQGVGPRAVGDRERPDGVRPSGGGATAGR